jgi:TRAP-type C4-dicarboxylate transport system permease small subunit
MTFMHKLDAIIAKGCQFILWLTMSIIFSILCINTLMRYAFGSGMQWANEVPEMLFPWLVMAGVVLAAVTGSHITTTFLRDKISPHAQRWLSVVVWGVVSVLYGTLSLATFKMLSIVHDEKSAILGVPQSVTFGCVMLGMVCLMVLAIKDTIVAWKTPAATLAATYAATGPNTNY